MFDNIEAKLEIRYSFIKQECAAVTSQCSVQLDFRLTK